MSSVLGKIKKYFFRKKLLTKVLELWYNGNSGCADPPAARPIIPHYFQFVN
jgi:hypothetical protein